MSAHERKPNKNPSSLHVPAPLTGTKRRNVEAGSKLPPFQGNLLTRGRVSLFCLAAATSAANAAPVRKRRAGSRQRMQCGGLPPLWAVLRVEPGPASSRCHRTGVEAGLPAGCYPPRGEAGALGARAVGGPLRARGDGGPAGWSVCGRTSSGRTISVHNSGRMSRVVGRWIRASGSIRVHSSGPASLGLRPGRKHCWVWRPSGATGASPCYSRHSRPAKGFKNGNAQVRLWSRGSKGPNRM